MSLILEKRKIQQEISCLKKKMITLDKMCESEIEKSIDYQSYACCTDQLLLCIYQIALKNIRCANDKMVVYQKAINDIISILNELKAAVNSAALNNSVNNITAQNIVIASLLERYNCIINNTCVCDCYLFVNNSNKHMCSCILVPEIECLLCRITFMFQNLSSDINVLSFSPSVVFTGPQPAVSPVLSPVINPITSITLTAGVITNVAVNLSSPGSGYPINTTLNLSNSHFVVYERSNGSYQVVTNLIATTDSNGNIIDIQITIPDSATYVDPVLFIYPSSTIGYNVSGLYASYCGINNVLLGFEILSAGSGYPANTLLNLCINDPTGSGAIFSVTSDGSGNIPLSSSITINNLGCGYTCPTISVPNTLLNTTINDIFPILNITLQNQCYYQLLITDINSLISFFEIINQTVAQVINQLEFSKNLVNSKLELRIENIKHFKNIQIEKIQCKIDNLSETLCLLKNCSDNCNKC